MEYFLSLATSTCINITTCTTTLVCNHFFCPIISLENAYKSNIKVLQIKQNHIASIMFFYLLYIKKNTGSPLFFAINKSNCRSYKLCHDHQKLSTNGKELPLFFDGCFHNAKKHSLKTRFV